ncbi:hypothetical protein [Paenibacillus larvae]|uniref:Uncharacterized protein n=1 Tax=Paenibacillus larvae subsp. larvae TaxID=147375 RepID=A0A2L1U453_9BACL|nr:hypothetical protein [Paenibacillus larvae]AQZ46074.1 hypothetical protein B5S25_05050 [Paenibacillus larvae subsp. pulvifaciens]AVF27723.1 hypothetical protein ERICIII_03613 [Paenibacillus larvae subsp. larvae]MBH0344123.1 hypothetical protein [Paenibacillus larvae]MCY7522100.1 hypothetical protein [Paenibacillus larvae]MCY9500866.1 hypothetical protein [Paenibacillus larvae]
MKDYKRLATERAKQIKKELGGKIFAFPINDKDPFSKYAIVVYEGGTYHVYPEAEDISTAAIGIKVTLEQYQRNGENLDYDRDVRFISYVAQMDAPDVRMRRLKKMQDSSKSLLQEDFDVTETEEGRAFSGRGIVKFSYLSAIEDKLPKAIKFMDEYYKLLATRKYGKTAAAIKQEVRRMTKDEAIRWIERTYRSYVNDDTEVIGMCQRL